MPEITTEMPVIPPTDPTADPAPDPAIDPQVARRRLLAVITVGAVAMAAVIGFALTREQPFRRSAGPVRVTGWAPYWQTDSSLASFTTNSAMFDTISLFAWSTVGADTIRAESIDPNALSAFTRSAAATGVPFIATVFDGMDKGQLAAVLADPVQRATHVQTLTRFVNDNGFAGIDLDYEQFAFADGRDSWATTRPNWVAFITDLGAALHASGKQLIVSAPPIYDASRSDQSGYWVYDFAAIAPHIDSLRVMAYDYSTSDPGPIAPLEWVSRVIAATRSMVPDAKIMLGLPIYGYSWVTSVSGTCPADQEPRRRNLSTRSANALALQPGVVSTWQPTEAERTLTYSEQLSGVDAAGAPVSCTVTRLAWYLDQQAVFARVALLQRTNLAGVALWSLGNDDDSVWEAILGAGSPTTVSTTTVP